MGEDAHVTDELICSRWIMTNSLTNFDDILGQAAAIEALTSAYKVDRLPHGLIFAGPQGVGKGTTARAL
jgi:predicted ATPase with chaperone activity